MATLLPIDRAGSSIPRIPKPYVGTVGSKPHPRTSASPETWSGCAGANVDVRRSEGSTFVTANGSSYRESWRGSGTVGYTICETGSTTACASCTTTI
jgi:hypothetical protein